MKKVILYLSVFTLVLCSCKKVNDEQIALKPSDKQISNSEIDRITKLLVNADEEVLINYYKSIGSGAENYKIQSGALDIMDSVEVKIGASDFKGIESNGQYLLNESSNDLSDCFGKSFAFQVITGLGIEDYTLYVPSKLEISHSMAGINDYDVKTSRTGNTITWMKDPSNKTGVLVEYTLYDSADILKRKEFEKGYFIIADGGSFNADVFFEKELVKSMKISFKRGNAIGQKLPSGKDLLVNFMSNDSKELWIVE